MLLQQIKMRVALIRNKMLERLDDLTNGRLRPCCLPTWAFRLWSSIWLPVLCVGWTTRLVHFIQLGHRALSPASLALALPFSLRLSFAISFTLPFPSALSTAFPFPLA